MRVHDLVSSTKCDGRIAQFPFSLQLRPGAGGEIILRPLKDGDDVTFRKRKKAAY